MDPAAEEFVREDDTSYVNVQPPSPGRLLLSKQFKQSSLTSPTTISSQASRGGKKKRSGNK